MPYRCATPCYREERYLYTTIFPHMCQYKRKHPCRMLPFEMRFSAYVFLLFGVTTIPYSFRSVNPLKQEKHPVRPDAFPYRESFMFSRLYNGRDSNPHKAFIGIPCLFGAFAPSPHLAYGEAVVPLTEQIILWVSLHYHIPPVPSSPLFAPFCPFPCITLYSIISPSEMPYMGFL